MVCPFFVRMKTVVSVKVEEETKKRLREEAEKEGISFNQMMEEIIENLMYLSGEVTLYEYVKDMAGFERVMRDG